VRNTTGALKRVDRLENKLVQQERNAKQAFRTLVAMYRADNTVARKSDEEVGPPPAHWSRGVQPLELDERAALKDTLELESKVQAWAAKIEERVEQIKHDENEKLNELKETRRQRRENRFKNRSLKGGAPPAAPLNTSAGSVADYNRQNKNRKDQ
jgi:hypothetical protein